MKYQFIESCGRRYPVDRLCAFVGASRSGYYRWRQRRPKRRETEDAQLGVIIEAEFQRNRQVYGKHRMQDRLRQLGRRHGRRRIRRLMRERGLNPRSKRRFVVTTQADPSHHAAPNVLNQEFTADGPNRTWLSDITLIPTDEGDLYLAATMDLWSRMIVGWAIQDTMTEELVHRAFDMAFQRRWPDPGTLHHSDQGSQYTANGFRNQLRRRRMIASHSRKGNVLDNAPMESFFATLEKELLQKKKFRTKADAIQEVFHFIEAFYNRQRIHTSLGGRSPAEFEAAGETKLPVH